MISSAIFLLPQDLLVPSPITVVYDTLGTTYHELLLHFHTYEIADQLTNIDWSIYSRIPKKYEQTAAPLIIVRELRQLKWEKPIEVVLGYNVAKLIQRLNKLAHWVATLVLLPEVNTYLHLLTLLFRKQSSEQLLKCISLESPRSCYRDTTMARSWES